MALGNLENIENIDPFVLLLKDNDPKIRLAAIKALAKIGNTDAIRPLSNLLVDHDIRKEVVRSDIGTAGCPHHYRISAALCLYIFLSAESLYLSM